MEKILSTFNFSQWLEQNDLWGSGCGGTTWEKRLRKLRGEVNGKGTLMHFVQIKMQKTQRRFVVLGVFSSFLSSRKYSWLMEKMGQQRCASPQYCCLDHIITCLKTHLSIPQSLYPVHSLTILENCEWQRNPSISTASRKARTH